MGVYDMTTAIDFILKSTGYSKLDMVGYSLGTTMSLACLSDRPEYNSKINKLVLMAPTSRLKSSGMPLKIIKKYIVLEQRKLKTIFEKEYDRRKNTKMFTT